jgi:hypothetical protein
LRGSHYWILMDIQRINQSLIPRLCYKTWHLFVNWIKCEACFNLPNVTSLIHNKKTQQHQN